MVRTHRLGPMLHSRLKQTALLQKVPEEIKAVLDKSFHISALRSLMLQRELLQLHKILTSADIPYVVLKGAYLAFHAYPNPAMKPMRDLDILVSRQRPSKPFRY